MLGMVWRLWERASRPFNAMRSIALLLLLTTTASAQFLGFDRNDYPGDDNLASLRKTFTFTGYWLNAPPGAKSNSWIGKRAVVEKAGFGFVVLYTGKTYAQLKGSEAESIGAADGLSAAELARKEGFPKGTVIFLDQEEGGRMLPAQKAYLLAWIDSVDSTGYRSGLYCSGIPAQEADSGTSIVTADDIRQSAADRKIVFFIANDSCPPAPGCTFKEPNISDTQTAYADIWQFAQSPRRSPYSDGCGKTYAADGNCYPPGLKLHVDLDVATSADPSHGRTPKH